VVAGLTLLSLIVRLYRISHPSEVVFDEVHFGGFAGKYIKGAFFMDVHPPLGKLLIAASGVLAGYDGNFSFKEIGLDYLEAKVPYITMRLFPGILGVLLVPMAYITMRNVGLSNASAVLTALAVLFENALATQSRLILLDSFLVFFTGLTVMMWTDFLSNQEMPFTFTWWYPLAMTGVSLGLAASVKWVGLFVIALVGMSTLHNLWVILGDLRVSPIMFMKHFLARAICLILIPITIYVFLFEIHFLSLPNTGTGTGFMSAEFQASLKGNEIAATYENVAFGSTIYLRHVATNGGYLHSHAHNYETGSKQQQITCYPFRDDNSAFLVKPMIEYINGTTTEKKVEGMQYLKDGDIIRLEHIPTKKHLHSHDHRPPVTENEHHNEASGYGQEGYLGDTNDHWRVEVTNKVSSTGPVKAITSKIRLIHTNTGCQLFSHNTKLPEWAYGQQEVTCAKNGKRSHTLWIVEYNVHPQFSESERKVTYRRPSFFSKFMESHKVMWNINQGLTSSHPYDSRPEAWPLLRRGISFWTAKNNAPGQIYLLGNPLVWYGSFISVFTFIVFYGATVLLRKRRLELITNIYLNQIVNAAVLFSMGWALHYFPFFLLRRQLFLHHYLPALYFAILLMGVVFDVVTHRLRPATKWVIMAIVFIAIFWTFVDFSPLTYGTAMHRHHCERLKWGKHWDWSCLSSPEDTHLY
ncbi:Dolichyl-phosphate-mannose-protein mannosyltransferase-domain-containing protein, partial [Zopfochytrium polystomum]